jgi:hypothetical protein
MDRCDLGDTTANVRCSAEYKRDNRAVLHNRRRRIRAMQEAEADGQSFWTEDFDSSVRMKVRYAFRDAHIYLADMARQTVTERWIDPRDGMDAYRAAGR